MKPNQIRDLSAALVEYQSVDSMALSEPRLPAIVARIKALLSVVQLESEGKPIDIDGFRLRDPAIWRAPQASANAELWHISTACNMRCPFCYEEGDPSMGSVLNEPVGMATINEIETRLRYFDPQDGRGLFQPLTYINEIFCNPNALEIMNLVRAKMLPGEVFTFVTNGTYLDDVVIRRLAALKPLFFNFSVNSLNTEIRRRILRDRTPDVAIAAPELLKTHGIPYLGSLVCWPTIPWDDIEATVRELDSRGCAVIRYSLSAFSRFLKTKKTPFDRVDFWNRGLELARRLQLEVDTPIKVEPFYYDQSGYEPHLVGTIKGSPASRAGLRPRDVLTSVAGRPVHTANQALSAIAVARNAGLRRITVSVKTPTGAVRTMILDDDDGPFEYPYSAMRDFKGFEWGLLLVENLKFGYLQQVRDIIDRHAARHILICSSELMRPIVQRMIDVSGAFDDVDLRLEVPQNAFFGGTIVLGDLLVVEDYVAFLREYTSTGRSTIDLVLIPSSPFSLGGWQRDLTGVPWTEIARRTGLPVELIRIDPLKG